MGCSPAEEDLQQKAKHTAHGTERSFDDATDKPNDSDDNLFKCAEQSVHGTEDSEEKAVAISFIPDSVSFPNQ